MRRIVTSLVLLLAVAAPAAAQLGGQNKIRYDTFEWQIYKTPHFEINFYDREEPSLERVASFSESAYDELARRLNFQILKPVTMLCYATHAEFEQNNVIVGFIPEGVGAFASPVRNRMVLPIDLPDEQLQALIQHELTHIFQYEILFQGWRGRSLFRRPPTWFMEGMASYFANDEDARAEAYMRDAAMAQRVPSVAYPLDGYFAYRFGHKVFQFIESEWGEDGVRDFVFAFRGGFGTSVEGPIKRTFNMSVDEFDGRFRAWLRKLYQPYADRGLPEEFGRRFYTGERSAEASPAATASGDLIVAFSTYKQDVDVVLFGVPDRKIYRNLTKGLTTKYEYLIAQNLTVGGEEGGGGDLSVSPDGNLVAVFARTERSRSLLLLDAIRGGIARMIPIPLPIDQPMSPAFSPDGGRIAFKAIRNGQFDIFVLNLADDSIVNLTDDPIADSAPVFSPDGTSLIYTAQRGENGKLIRLSLDNPAEREQLTFGPGTDEAPSFSKDGKRIYFASDRQDKILDIYAYDTETRQLTRVTHVIGAAVNPIPIQTLLGERVVFQGFGSGSWDLYVADPNQGEPVAVAPLPTSELQLDQFVPAVSIPIDLENNVVEPKRKFYLEDVGAIVGIDQNSDLISSSYLTLSDQYGDRRMMIQLQTIQSYSIFDAAYMNLNRRLEWGISVFDHRSYYLSNYSPVEGTFRDARAGLPRDRRLAARFLSAEPLLPARGNGRLCRSQHRRSGDLRSRQRRLLSAERLSSTLRRRRGGWRHHHLAARRAAQGSTLEAVGGLRPRHRRCGDAVQPVQLRGPRLPTPDPPIRDRAAPLHGLLRGLRADHLRLRRARHPARLHHALDRRQPGRVHQHRVAVPADRQPQPAVPPAAQRAGAAVDRHRRCLVPDRRAEVQLAGPARLHVQGRGRPSAGRRRIVRLGLLARHFRPADALGLLEAVGLQGHLRGVAVGLLDRVPLLTRGSRQAPAAARAWRRSAALRRRPESST